MTDKEKAALEKIKKLEETIAKKKALLVREKGRLSVKDRKARTRKLIEIGGLAEIAEVQNRELGFLLGVFLYARDISPTSSRFEDLKSNGDALLKEREKARKKSAKS